MQSRTDTLEGILLDLDGVFYEGDRPVPGGAECVAWLRTQGIPQLFLTNTTSRPRSALVERLAGLGIDVEETAILTPPVAAVRWLERETSGPVALFVPPATAEEFAHLPRLPDTEESGAAAIVIGDLGQAWDFRTLNRAFRLLMAEPAPKLVALGMTRYWRAPEGLQLDVAAFVKALEHATGAEAVVLGKPAAPFFYTALELLGLPAGKVAVLGDDIIGDVEAAQKLGLRGILVRTGKFRPADLERPGAPDAVLESVAELPDWWPGP
jgi:HAD superfamily hydrolase (TIGR01458 family)